jgi:hypothetical protein
MHGVAFAGGKTHAARRKSLNGNEGCPWQMLGSGTVQAVAGHGGSESDPSRRHSGGAEADLCGTGDPEEVQLTVSLHLSLWKSYSALVVEEAVEEAVKDAGNHRLVPWRGLLAAGGKSLAHWRGQSVS